MRKREDGEGSGQDRIMIIGGGAAGQAVIKEAASATVSFHVKVCCVIDDSPNKWGRMLEGIPIVGRPE